MVIYTFAARFLKRVWLFWDNITYKVNSLEATSKNFDFDKIIFGEKSNLE